MLRILIVQTSFLGDAVLSTPAFSEIKNKYPESELSILTTPLAKELFKYDPRFKRVLTFDKHHSESGMLGLYKKALELRKFRFNVAFIMQRSFRTSCLIKLVHIPRVVGFEHALFPHFFYDEVRVRPKHVHAVLRYSSIVYDDVSDEKKIEMRLFAPEYEQLSSEFKTLLINKDAWVVMAPGSAWETKRWDISGYKEIYERLRTCGKEVFIIGSNSERKLASVITSSEYNLAGKISLSETLYLIRNATLLICNDSMSLHVGSAFKIPTVAIFCATSPSFGFGPWHNDKAIVVENASLACRPCARHGSRECPNGTKACIKGVTIDDVWSAVNILSGLKR